jgi:hypothetical protein
MRRRAGWYGSGIPPVKFFESVRQVFRPSRLQRGFGAQFGVALRPEGDAWLGWGVSARDPMLRLIVRFADARNFLRHPGLEPVSLGPQRARVGCQDSRLALGRRVLGYFFGG